MSGMAAKLTMKLARELAMKQFGTAKGLKKSDSFPGRYEMRFGQLGIEIGKSIYESGLIAVKVRMDVTEGRVYYYDPDTLERDYYADERDLYRKKRKYLTRWVDKRGAERCKAEIDKIANRYE